MKIQVQKVKIIKLQKGNIFKIISKKSILFEKFGEIYLSEVKPNIFKGWKYHNSNTQLLTVIKGTVEFSIKKRNKILRKVVSYPNNLYIIKIPSKTYYSFKCKSKQKSIILNITDKVFW